MNTLEITFGLDDTQFDEDDRSVFATQLSYTILVYLI